MENETKKIIETFFEKLNLSIESIDIKENLDNNIFIKIKTPDSSLFIGSHGKNLESFEIILKSMISRGKERIRLHIEINDYINSRDEKLFFMIKEKINLLKKGVNDIKISNLNPYERKKVHAFVSDLQDTKIYTKSIGEGNERSLYICKISPKMTLDIDGNNI